MYFVLITAEQQPWRNLLEWMVEKGVAADLVDPAYDDPAYRQAQFPHIQEIVEAFFLLQTADEAYHDGQARGLPIGVINAPRIFSAIATFIPGFLRAHRRRRRPGRSLPGHPVSILLPRPGRPDPCSPPRRAFGRGLRSPVAPCHLPHRHRSVPRPSRRQAVSSATAVAGTWSPGEWQPGACSITGIGTTDFSRSSGRSDLTLATQAALAAIDDAGLGAGDIDGVVRCDSDHVRHTDLAEVLGIDRLTYWGECGPGGVAPCAMIGQAIGAILSGQATNVLSSAP